MILAEFKGCGMAWPKNQAGTAIMAEGPEETSPCSPPRSCLQQTAHQLQDCLPQGPPTGPRDGWGKEDWAPAAESPAVPIVSCSFSLVSHFWLSVPAPFAPQKKETHLSHPVYPPWLLFFMPPGFSLPTSSLYTPFSASSVFWEGKPSPPATLISFQNWISFPPDFPHLIVILHIF